MRAPAAFFAAVVLAAVIACGGTKASGPGIFDLGDSGSGAPGCVDISFVDADLACALDSDCGLQTTGTVCTGECGCPTMAVNMQKSRMVAAQLDGLRLAACPCVLAGIPRCIAGRCTLCPIGPGGGPEMCPDAG